MFDAAHVEFAVLSPLLWEPMGEATVARSRPLPGERVLDVCCGSGASAFPAAEAVGPTGRVDGIDLSARLIERGRALAAERGLAQLNFTTADATTWPTAGYDLVQCVYGVFFLPDMDADAARLISLLRPGGRFAATTWAHGAISPVPEILIDAIRQENAGDPPDTAPRSAGQRINTPGAFNDWLFSLGLREITVTELPYRIPLGPDSAWALVMGAAMRTMLMGMRDETVERVRARFVDLLAASGTATLNATSLIGVGQTAQ